MKILLHIPLLILSLSLNQAFHTSKTANKNDCIHQIQCKLSNDDNQLQKNLTICVDKNGTFQYQSEMETPNLDVIAETVYLLSGKANENIKIWIHGQKKKGAMLTDLNDGSISLRIQSADLSEKVVLIDLKNSTILGYNYYNNKNELINRVVFHYQNTAENHILKSASLIQVTGQGENAFSIEKIIRFEQLELKALNN